MKHVETSWIVEHKGRRCVVCRVMGERVLLLPILEDKRCGVSYATDIENCVEVPDGQNLIYPAIIVVGGVQGVVASTSICEGEGVVTIHFRMHLHKAPLKRITRIELQ